VAGDSGPAYHAEASHLNGTGMDTSNSSAEGFPPIEGDGGWETAPAVESLVPLLYDRLRELAHRQLAGERPDHTLQTTALVHEAYLRLAGGGAGERGREYFFAAAARAMRQVLVDHARRRGALRRGGGRTLVTLEHAASEVDAFAAELLDLDRALEALAERSPRLTRVVECRFFGGMSVDDTASALGVSPRTVKHDWALARAWLHEALSGVRGPG
jgi:RNA polymerase sigma factor (TIGR02999 family)